MPRTLLLAAGLLVVVCAAAAQTPSLKLPGKSAIKELPPVVPPAAVPGPSAVPGEPLGFTPVPPPVENRVDDLIAELEALLVDKARIEKKEQELRAEIRRKLDALNEKVNNLGAGPGTGPAVGRVFNPTVAAAPARVGRIIIEGADDKKVDIAARQALEKAGLTPGQVYRRSALDQAREGMVSAGLTRVSLETVTSGQSAGGGAILDIRVRFATEGDR
jgi:hypothetical protein